MRSQKADIHDVRVLHREIKRRCADHRITVQFAKNIDTAYSTDTGIIIPSIDMPLTREQLQLIRYYMIHEVGHHLRYKAFELLKAAGITDKRVHGIWNMCEDEQLEREAQGKYLGDRKSLGIGRELHIRDMLDRWSRDSKGGTAEPCDDSAKAVAVHAVACKSRTWHKQVEHLVEDMLLTCGPKVRAIFDELVSEGWHERMAEPLNEEETRDLAFDLFSRLYPSEDPEQQPEQDKGEGDDGEGEGDEAQQNDGDNSEENQDDAADEDEKCSKSSRELDKDGEPDDKRSEGQFTIPWDEVVGSEHDGGAPSGDSLVIDYNGWSEQGGVQFMPDERIAEHEPSPDGRGVWCETIEYHPDTTFANQMRRHIQSEARDRWESNRKTGRLNVRAIKRIKTGTREHNRRIFKRRHDHEAINTCITVLVDWSGSMFGSRAEIAANAAGVLVDSFSHVLNVPVEVLAHTTGGGKLVMYKVKTFNERHDGATVVDKLSRCDMCGNADGDALMYAYDRIVKRPEKRKIILAIADGQPTDAYHCDAGSVLKAAIKAVRQGGVEAYGIGAQHHEIKRWYGEDSEVVDDLDQMSRVLLRTAEKFVLNR